MSVHATCNGSPVPDFIQLRWHFEFEADACRRERVFGVGAAVLGLCVVSIVWVAMAGSVVALWLIGGFWIVAALTLSVSVGRHSDTFAVWAADS